MSRESTKCLSSTTRYKLLTSSTESFYLLSTIMSTLRSVIILIRYQPWFFLVTCLAWGVFHSLPLVIALLIREIFDVLSGSSAIGMNVWTLLALIVATSLSRVTVMVGGVWLWSTAYYTLASLIRRNIFDWIMTGPGTKRLPGSPGEAITRFRDDVHEVLMTVENWTDFTGILFMLVGGIVVMANIDPFVALVAMAPLVGVLIFGYAVGDKIQRYRRATLEATGRITSFVGEVFGGVQAVKVAAAEKDVIRHFEKLNSERHDAAVRDVLFNSLFRTINTNMAFVGIGLVMLMVAGTTRGGSFNAGDFFLFTYFLQHLSWNMFFVGDVIAQHKRTGVSLERLRELTPEAPEELVVQKAKLYMKGNPPQVLICQKGRNDKLRQFEAQNLIYRHPSTGRGIEGIDLEIRRGDFVVITGKIGAGKTTLLRALLGLVEVEEGEVYWNGARIIDPASFMTPPRVSYTSQVPRLFSDTLRDNILMGQAERHEIITEAVQLAVMESDIDILEEGLDTKVGPRGVKLSGGQVQRSAAARMFVRETELFIIDDLSSALDVETEAILWQPLFERRDVTCIVASHRRAALRRADKIILLDKGKVDAVGSLDELLEKNETMRTLWESKDKSGGISIEG